MCMERAGACEEPSPSWRKQVLRDTTDPLAYEGQRAVWASDIWSHLGGSRCRHQRALELHHDSFLAMHQVRFWTHA